MNFADLESFRRIILLGMPLKVILGEDILEKLFLAEVSLAPFASISKITNGTRVIDVVLES